MNVYVEKPGETTDVRRGQLVNVADPQDIIAATFRGNPLRESFPELNELASNRLVAWSGTLAEDLFEPHPMTWMAVGHEQFNAVCEALREPLRAADCTVCFQPHARHVLNDVQSTLTFLNTHVDGPFELAFDPAALLEPSMFHEVDEHLNRSFELLGPRCALLMLRNIDFDPATNETHRQPLTDGRVSIDLLLALTTKHIKPDTPIILHDARIDEQLQHLRALKPDTAIQS